MRATTNKTIENAQDQSAKKGYTSPRLIVYGTVTDLTKGSSGSRADGAGSQGSGNQGSAG